ncbi:unnamed protein product [Prorocentrum cordatum]|uniref:Uncharacterized protein n=1 Tax=Prorocentrum cordatum TaxID=2364126 RepID=A0ABN9WU02_9DINO|nr:unnamed protein product [Polarella glacialis]
MLAAAAARAACRIRFASTMLGAHGLNFAKGAEEIRSGLSALVDTYEAKVEALVAESTKLLAEGGAERDPRRLFEAAFHRLADADGHASLASAELTLPALVSGDREARAASSEAKKALQQMWARAHIRRRVQGGRPR